MKLLFALALQATAESVDDRFIYRQALRTISIKIVLDNQ